MPEASHASASNAHAADPESILAGGAPASGLSADERKILLRANGRRWEPISTAELGDYLSHQVGTANLVHVWDRTTGATGLRDAASGPNHIALDGAEVMILVVGTAVDADDQIALRESQIVSDVRVVSVGVLEAVIGVQASTGAWYRSAVAPGSPPSRL